MNYKQRERLAELVKELRGERSRRRFGQVCLGVGGNTVKEWEECITSPNLENLKKIAKLAGCNSIDDLEQYLNGDNENGRFIPEQKIEEIEAYVKTSDLEEVYQVHEITTRRLVQLASVSKGKYKV